MNQRVLFFRPGSVVATYGVHVITSVARSRPIDVITKLEDAQRHLINTSSLNNVGNLTSNYMLRHMMAEIQYGI